MDDCIANPHIFIGQEEIKGSLPLNTTPFYVFNLLFDDKLLFNIVQWTNSYALSLTKPEMWKKVTRNELLDYLALNIAMSVTTFFRYAKCWNKKEFSNVMKLYRFQQITKYIRIFDPATDEINTQAIQDVLDHLTGNFRKFYYPGEKLSLDESLVRFQDQSSLKKRYSRNIGSCFRIYELSTPDRYILNTFITSNPSLDNSIISIGEYSNAVYRLIADNYLRKGHTIYCDAAYVSYKLASKLYPEKTNIVGSVAIYRKDNPKCVVTKKMKTSECCFHRSDTMLITKLKNLNNAIKGRIVIPMEPNPSQNIENEIDETGEDFVIGGIDRIDQFISFRHSSYEHRSWSLTLFWHLIDMTIINSLKIYNLVNEKCKLDQNEFRKKLFNEMISSNNLNPLHSPIRLPNKKRIHCRVCSKNKIRKGTNFACSTCKTSGFRRGPIGLCVDCFDEYDHYK